MLAATQPDALLPAARQVVDESGLALSIDGRAQAPDNLAHALVGRVQQRAAAAARRGEPPPAVQLSDLAERRGMVADAMLLRLLAVEWPKTIHVDDAEVAQYVDSQRAAVAGAVVPGVDSAAATFIDSPEAFDGYRDLLGSNRLRAAITAGSPDPRAALVGWLRAAIGRHEVVVGGVGGWSPSALADLISASPGDAP